MKRTVVVELEVTVCDRCADLPAVTTRKFAVDQTNYKLDLCSRDSERLDRALKPYVDCAEPAKALGERVAVMDNVPDGVTADIHAWMRHNKIPPGRGRSPKNPRMILEYQQAVKNGEWPVKSA